MPHAKCLHCRSRVWCDLPADEPPATLCPGCGSELEAVSDLSELVGLRSLGARPKNSHLMTSDHFERISRQIRETIARHDAERRRSDTGAAP